MPAGKLFTRDESIQLAFLAELGKPLCDHEETYDMRPKTILIPINLVALMLVGTLTAQAQESLFGTWKMNAAKSK